MRALLLLLAVICAAIGIALGALVFFSQTSAVNFSAVTQMLATVEHARDTQIAVGLYDPGDPVAAVSGVLDLSCVSPGMLLDSPGAKVHDELFIFLERQPLFEAIGAGGREYWRIDFSLLRPAFPTAREQSELGALQSRYGDRWLLASPSQHGSAPSPSASSTVAGRKFLAALSQAIENHATLEAARNSNGDNGVRLSGSLSELLPSLQRALRTLEGNLGGAILPSPHDVTRSGSYLVALFGDSSGALRQVQIGLSDNGSSSGFGIVINHGQIAINAPGSALPFPPAALRALLGFARALIPTQMI